MATDGAFPRDRELTSIAIAYKNPDVSLIADAIFPRKPVGKLTFDWMKYPDEQQFTVPDTRIGERSTAYPTLELSGTKLTSKCEDNGLQANISNDDLSEAPKGIDPKAVMTEAVTNLVLLRREIECANLAFDAAQYAAANKVTLAGAGQWSDVTSSPLAVIRAALNSCLIRPNVFVIGQAVWDALAIHPKLVKAATGSDSGEGICTLERLAQLLEISEVVVGKAFVNTAKAGNAATMVRAWGKSALALYRDRSAAVNGGLTYGFTAQFGTREAGAKPIDMGARGGVAVRVQESTKPVIVAPGAAFLWTAAAA